MNKVKTLFLTTIAALGTAITTQAQDKGEVQAQTKDSVAVEEAFAKSGFRLTAGIAPQIQIAEKTAYTQKLAVANVQAIYEVQKNNIRPYVVADVSVPLIGKPVHDESPYDKIVGGGIGFGAIVGPATSKFVVDIRLSQQFNALQKNSALTLHAPTVATGRVVLRGKTASNRGFEFFGSISGEFDVFSKPKFTPAPIEKLPLPAGTVVGFGVNFDLTR